MLDVEDVKKLLEEFVLNKVFRLVLGVLDELDAIEANDDALPGVLLKDDNVTLLGVLGADDELWTRLLVEDSGRDGLLMAGKDGILGVIKAEPITIVLDTIFLLTEDEEGPDDLDATTNEDRTPEEMAAVELVVA